MKLSEAIRAGAKIRPKCIAEYFSSDGKSCAIGAALEGIGVEAKPFNNSWINVEKELTELGFLDEDLKFKPLWGRIVFMNDEEFLTREEIADILEKEGL